MLSRSSRYAFRGIEHLSRWSSCIFHAAANRTIRTCPRHHTRAVHSASTSKRSTIERPAVVRHLRARDRRHAEAFKHAHRIKLVEAEKRRVVVRAFDDVSARSNRGFAERTFGGTDWQRLRFLRRDELRHGARDGGARIFAHQRGKMLGRVVAMKDILDIQCLQLGARRDALGCHGDTADPHCADHSE